MTRHELLLEELTSDLLVHGEDLEPSILVHKVREAWLRRLKAIYPQLTAKLGRKCEDYYLDYLKLNLPQSWNPQIFGGDLPKFFKEISQFKKGDKYLPELADFEWAVYWVQMLPLTTIGTDTYLLNPFVRILRHQFGIWEWWQTKSNIPKTKSELVSVSKSRKGKLVIFELGLVEAALIDAVSENSMNLEQLIAATMSALTGAQRIQVEVALNSLMEKGVIFGPALAPAAEEPTD